MIYLMNSAVMPAGNFGGYRYTPATVADLKAVMRGEHGPFTSCIGYPQNADLIEEWTGVRPEISRRKTFFEDGDLAMVMRLPDRVADPATKGAKVSESPEDWEFAWVNFSAA